MRKFYDAFQRVHLGSKVWNKLQSARKRCGKVEISVSRQVGDRIDRLSKSTKPGWLLKIWNMNGWTDLQLGTAAWSKMVTYLIHCRIVSIRSITENKVLVDTAALNEVTCCKRLCIFQRLNECQIYMFENKGCRRNSRAKKQNSGKSNCKDFFAHTNPMLSHALVEIDAETWHVYFQRQSYEIFVCLKISLKSK